MPPKKARLKRDRIEDESTNTSSGINNTNKKKKAEEEAESLAILDVDKVVLDEHPYVLDDFPECDEEIEVPARPPDNKERLSRGLQHLSSLKEDYVPLEDDEEEDTPPGYYAYQTKMIQEITKEGSGYWESIPIHTGNYSQSYPIESQQDGNHVVKDWPRGQLRIKVNGESLVSIVTLFGEPAPGSWEPSKQPEYYQERADDICTALTLNRAHTVFAAGDRTSLLTPDLPELGLTRLLGSLSLTPKPPIEGEPEGGLLDDTYKYVKGVIPEPVIVGIGSISQRPVSVCRQTNWKTAYKHETIARRSGAEKIEDAKQGIMAALDLPGIKGLDVKSELGGAKVPHSFIPFYEYVFPRNWTALKSYIRSASNTDDRPFPRAIKALNAFRCQISRYEEWVCDLRDALAHRTPIPALILEYPVKRAHECGDERAPDVMFDRDGLGLDEFTMASPEWFTNTEDNPAFSQMYLMFPEKHKWTLPRKLERILSSFLSYQTRDTFNVCILIAAAWTWVAMEAQRREDMKPAKLRRDLGLGEWCRNDPGINTALPEVSLGIFLLYFETMIRKTIQHRLAGFPHPFHFARTAYDIDVVRSPEFKLREECMGEISAEDLTELVAELKHRMAHSIKVYPKDLDGTFYPMIETQVSYKGAVTGIGTMKFNVPPLSRYLKGSDIYREDSFIRAVAERRPGAQFEAEPAPGPEEFVDTFRWDRADQAARVRSYYPAVVILGNPVRKWRTTDNYWYHSHFHREGGISKEELLWAKQDPYRLVCLRWLSRVEGLDCGWQAVNVGLEENEKPAEKHRSIPETPPRPFDRELSHIGDKDATAQSWELALEHHCRSLVGFFLTPLTEVPHPDIIRHKTKLLVEYYKMLMSSKQSIPANSSLKLGKELQSVIHSFPDFTTWMKLSSEEKQSLAKQPESPMEEIEKSKESALGIESEESFRERDMGDDEEEASKPVSAKESLLQAMIEAANTHRFGHTKGGREFLKGLEEGFSGSELALPSFPELVTRVHEVNEKMAEAIQMISSCSKIWEKDLDDSILIEETLKDIKRGVDHIFPGVWIELNDIPIYPLSSETPGEDLGIVLELFKRSIEFMTRHPSNLTPEVVGSLASAIWAALKTYNYPEEWVGLLEEYGESHPLEMEEGLVMAFERV